MFTDLYYRCETHYQTIDEKSYNEECEEEINHVCKEHITVPVEVPYPTEVPYHDYVPDVRPHYIPTTPYPRQPKSYEATPHPTVSYSPTPYGYPKDPTVPSSHQYHKEPSYLPPYPHNHPTHPPSYHQHADQTPIPLHLFPPQYREPQGVTINPHGANQHHSPTPHFNRRKREGEAASESEADASSEAKADSDSQFGNLIYGDLFKRIIQKADGSNIKTRTSQRSQTRGPDILGGIVNLSPNFESRGENKLRTGRLKSDINNFKGSLRNQNSELVIGENTNKEFSNLLLVNGELRNVLGSPITQSPSVLHRDSQFSNILRSNGQEFSQLGGSLRDLASAPLGGRFRVGAPGVSNIFSDTTQARTLEERVKNAMFNILQDVPELGGAFDGFQFDARDNVAIKQIKSGKFPEEKIVHATIEHDPHSHLHHGEHLNHHHDTHQHQHQHHHLHPDVHLHHQSDHLSHDLNHHDPHTHDFPEVHPEDHISKPVPTVEIVELPAEPGCRSFSTKTCHKVPIVVPKKVPYEECRKVPAVDCFFILKTVDDIECSPTSVEDCTNTAIEVPYLDQEEICEDIEFDDCVDVEEQVPIQVCRSQDPNRVPIINREIEGTSKRKGGRRTGEVSRPSSLQFQ